MNNSIIPVIKELERIYDTLSKQYNLKYDRPIITVQTKGRKKETLGWFWDKKWTHGKKEIGEINICAEDLNKNPIETLVHEMVHYSNSCDKIEDCNNHGYHNKYFKLKAEKYGLNVNKTGRHGWGKTSLGKDLQVILNNLKINYKVFEIYRNEHKTFTLPTKMKKWKCECTTIRCATDLRAKCLNCNKTFEERD